MSKSTAAGEQNNHNKILVDLASLGSPRNPPIKNTF